MLSRLLWAASREAGEAPGPMLRLDIHVLLEAGCFVYDPRAHALRQSRPLDLRLPREAAFAADAIDLAYVARVAPGAHRAVAVIDSAIVGGRVQAFCDAHGLACCLRQPAQWRELEQLLCLRQPHFLSFVQSVDCPHGG